MSAEDDVRALLRTAATDPGGVPSVDPGTLVAASRRRRRRRHRLAGAGIAVVAVLGAAVVLPRLGDDGGAEREELATGGQDDPGAEEGWTRLPDPPLSPRTGATAVWTGEEVVVFGGWDFLCPPGAECAPPTDLQRFADGAAYDPGSGGWRSIAPLPTADPYLLATALGGDVYALCAGSPCATETGLLRYRSDQDRWEQLAGPPRPVGALLPYGERLVGYSSSDEAGETPDYVYDPAAGTWTELPDDPMPSLYDRQVVVDGDDLLLFGKATSAASADPNVVVAARYENDTGAWRVLPSAPGTGYQAWGIDGVVILNPHFGLAATGGIFDPRSETWSDLPPRPDAESWQGDMAGALGSSSAEFEYFAGWVLDVAPGTWLEIPPLDGRTTSQQSALAPFGRNVFVFGGEDWSDVSESGRLLGDAWIWTPPSPPTPELPSADGAPTVWSQPPSTSNEGMAALVEGTVRYDAANECFQLEGIDAVTYPLVWPAGTQAAADGDGVVLPDGTRARVGDTVSGGGGYLAADSVPFAIPVECRPPTGEVATFNPNGAVEVRPA